MAAHRGVQSTVKEGKEKRRATHLVNLLDGGAVIVAGTRAGAASTREAAGTAGTAGEATGGTAGSTASTVELHHDGVGDTLELLLVLLVLLAGSLLALVEPRDNLVNLSLESLLVGSIELLVDLGVGKSVAERVGVRLKAVLGSDAAALGLILLLELLSLGQHALDVLLGKTTLVVGNDNLVGLASALLNGGDVHDTVGVHVEGNLDLGDTAGGRGNARELELAEQVVVLGALALTLVDLDEDTGLVVGEGREDLGLLGGDRGVAGDELGHHATSGLNTERQGRNVEEQDLVGRLGRGVAGENGGLDGGTVGNGLIGVDRTVGLLSVEVIGNELLNTGDTGGTADEDDLVDLRLVDFSIRKDAVDGLEGRAEEILAQLLEAGASDRGVEVDTLEQGVDLNGRLGGRRQGALGALASSAKTAQGADVGGEIWKMLAVIRE